MRWRTKLAALLLAGFAVPVAAQSDLPEADPALAERLAADQLMVNHLVCSDLTRTRQTATPSPMHAATRPVNTWCPA